MAHLDKDDKKLTFIPMDVATVPPGGLIEHLKDRWWSVCQERGLILYQGSPQCNGSEAIAKDLQKRLYPWADVTFVPSAFRRINPRDYC